MLENSRRNNSFKKNICNIVGHEASSICGRCTPLGDELNKLFAQYVGCKDTDATLLSFEISANKLLREAQTEGEALHIKSFQVVRRSSGGYIIKIHEYPGA